MVRLSSPRTVFGERSIPYCRPKASSLECGMACEFEIEQDPDPTPRVGQDFWERIQGLAPANLHFDPEKNDIERSKVGLYLLAHSQNVRDFFIKGSTSSEKMRLGEILKNYWSNLIRSRSSR